MIFKFKSVMEVNKFLYNHNFSCKTRSLGQLRMNVVPKRLIPDHNGSYRLVTTDVARAGKLEKEETFKISQVGRGGGHVQEMAFLLFVTKPDLFEFILFSTVESSTI